MTESTVTFTVRVADLASTKLLIVALEMLASDMRVGADPYAERLTQIVDRYLRHMDAGAEGADTERDE